MELKDFWLHISNHGKRLDNDGNNHLHFSFQG